MSLWDSVKRWWRRKTPAQRLAVLGKRLEQLEELERAAEADLVRLRARNGETRAIKKATRRLARLRKRTQRIRRAVAKAKPFADRASQVNKR